MPRVAVIGAGVVGLSTAINLQRRLPPSSVITVLAELATVDTTSDGAFGIVTPSHQPGVEAARMRSWVRQSFEHLSELASSEAGPEAGVFNLSGFYLSNSPDAVDAFNGLVYECRRVDADIVNRHFGGRLPKTSCAFFVSTVVAECRDYLPYLTKMFTSAGGEIHRRKIKSLDDPSLLRDFDIIVNCSGLGARDLAHDAAVFPARGQTLRVAAPWIKQFVYAPAGVIHDDYQLAVLPGQHDVLLGGCFQPGRADIAVTTADRESIRGAAETVVPSLRLARVVREWAGLRPCRRGGLRLEAERCGEASIVVHNYGHGTDGVALSWGTGIEAAEMVKGLVQGAKL